MSTIVDVPPDAQLAARLKTERESRGWTIAQLAQRAGVSSSMISKIERGDSSPTAALLGRLSAAFGLTLSQLLTRAEGGGGRVSRADDQPVWTDPQNGFVRRLVTPEAGEATRLELVRATLPPGVSVGYPAQAYAFIEDQQIVCLEGVLTFTQGEVASTLAAGDGLRLGAPADCIFENRGQQPCSYLIALLRSAR